MQLVEFGELLLQQEQQRPCVIDRNAQGGGLRIVAPGSGKHQCIDVDRDDALVVPHRL
jgi:hypothetical protein